MEEFHSTFAIKGGIYIKYIWLLLTLVPLPFLVFFVDIVLVDRGIELFYVVAIVAIGLIIVIGGLSSRVFILHVVIANLLTIILSLFLAVSFLVPPNPSWFNPFTMEMVVLLTGIASFIAQLIVRSIFRASRRQSRVTEKQ
ncbi:hypothetical protein FLK61_25955 [Paenalkalicoccus suaedae]|uniref:Uncharacterized protein n=1 Tax=Paenalkalicoccus suaedae TaxID=2592382 RepID=A0A859FAE7_9BACI|nr:hypothetical protein [Paenalkalicoccus suaedae]QKS70209.1 hypothetical protein FLK61_25955 [Paenalkalicoccus suaedae]